MFYSKDIDYIVSEVRRKLALHSSGVSQTRTTLYAFAEILEISSGDVWLVEDKYLTVEEKSQWKQLPLHIKPPKPPRVCPKGSTFVAVIAFTRECLDEIRQGERQTVPTLDSIGKKFGNISRQRVRQIFADGLTKEELAEWKKYLDPAMLRQQSTRIRRQEIRQKRRSRIRRATRYARWLIRLLESGRIARLPSIPTMAGKLGILTSTCFVWMKDILNPDEIKHWSKTALTERMADYLSSEAERFRHGEVGALPANKTVGTKFGVYCHGGNSCLSKSFRRLSSEDREVWRGRANRE